MITFLEIIFFFFSQNVTSSAKHSVEHLQRISLEFWAKRMNRYPQSCYPLRITVWLYCVLISHCQVMFSVATKLSNSWLTEWKLNVHLLIAICARASFRHICLRQFNWHWRVSTNEMHFWLLISKRWRKHEGVCHTNDLWKSNTNLCGSESERCMTWK